MTIAIVTGFNIWSILNKIMKIKNMQIAKDWRIMLSIFSILSIFSGYAVSVSY